MPIRRLPPFKHIFSCALLVANIIASHAGADSPALDVLSGGRDVWRRIDPGPVFAGGDISGASSIRDGAITDPAASTFLVSKAIFGGDVAVSMDVGFDKGRYLGIHLDFDQDTLTVTCRKTGGIPAGPLQIRLNNAREFTVLSSCPNGAGTNESRDSGSTAAIIGERKKTTTGELK